MFLKRSFAEGTWNKGNPEKGDLGERTLEREVLDIRAVDKVVSGRTGSECSFVYTEFASM